MAKLPEPDSQGRYVWPDGSSVYRAEGTGWWVASDGDWLHPFRSGSRATLFSTAGAAVDALAQRGVGPAKVAQLIASERGLAPGPSKPAGAVESPKLPDGYSSDAIPAHLEFRGEVRAPVAGEWYLSPVCFRDRALQQRSGKQGQVRPILAPRDAVTWQEMAAIGASLLGEEMSETAVPTRSDGPSRLAAAAAVAAVSILAVVGGAAAGIFLAIRLHLL